MSKPLDKLYVVENSPDTVGGGGETEAGSNEPRSSFWVWVECPTKYQLSFRMI